MKGSLLLLLLPMLLTCLTRWVFSILFLCILHLSWLIYSPIWSCIIICPFSAFTSFRTSAWQTTTSKKHYSSTFQSSHWGFIFYLPCFLLIYNITFHQLFQFTHNHNFLNAGKRSREREETINWTSKEANGRGKCQDSKSSSISLHHWLSRGMYIVYAHALIFIFLLY